MHFEMEWVLEIHDTELTTSNSLFSLHKHRSYYKDIAERCSIVYALYCNLSYTSALKREVKPIDGQKKELLDDFLKWWAFVLILCHCGIYSEISQHMFVMFTFDFFSFVLIFVTVTFTEKFLSMCFNVYILLFFCYLIFSFCLLIIVSVLLGCSQL